MNKMHEEHELELLGLIPVEVESLPEPATFVGKSTWIGISGKQYLVNPHWWIVWDAIYEGFTYSEKVNSRELKERYNDPTIRIIRKELL